MESNILQKHYDEWNNLLLINKFNKTVPTNMTGQLKECADVITHLDYKMLDIKNKMEDYK